MTTAINNNHAAIPAPPIENEDVWTAHRQAITEALAPQGAMEKAVVDRIALILWRQTRLAKYEADLTTLALEEVTDPLPSSVEFDLPDLFATKKKASPEQQKSREDRDRRKHLAEATLLDETTLAKIAQWERHLSKELMRTLKHLQAVRSLRG
jgi:hypothetical protein